MAWPLSEFVGSPSRTVSTLSTESTGASFSPVTFTVISTVQLVASVVLPGLAAAAGATEWVVPSIAITIGLFLVTFAGPLRVPAVRR